MFSASRHTFRTRNDAWPPQVVVVSMDHLGFVGLKYAWAFEISSDVPLRRVPTGAAVEMLWLTARSRATFPRTVEFTVPPGILVLTVPQMAVHEFSIWAASAYVLDADGKIVELSFADLKQLAAAVTLPDSPPCKHAFGCSHCGHFG